MAVTGRRSAIRAAREPGESSVARRFDVAEEPDRDEELCNAIRQAAPVPASTPDDDTTAVLSVWQYLGSGYLHPGDVLLAAGFEASLRVAREALLDLRRGLP